MLVRHVDADGDLSLKQGRTKNKKNSSYLVRNVPFRYLAHMTGMLEEALRIILFFDQTRLLLHYLMKTSFSKNGYLPNLTNYNYVLHEQAHLQGKDLGGVDACPSSKLTRSCPLYSQLKINRT